MGSATSPPACSPVATSATRCGRSTPTSRSPCSRCASRRGSRRTRRRSTSASTPIRSTSTATNPSSPTTSGRRPSGTGSNGGRRSTTATLADQAWQTVAGRFRPGRARYLVETLRPTNAEPRPSGYAGVPRHATAGDHRGRGRSRRRLSPSTGWPSATRPARRSSGCGRNGRCPTGSPPDRRPPPKKRRRNHRTTPSCPRSRTPSAGRSTSTPHATPAWR